LLAVAAVAALVWTLSRLDAKRLLEIGREADPWWLALSVVPIAMRFLLWGVKWKFMLALRERIPLSLAMRILAAGSFVNLTTPTAKLAGGVVRALLLRRRRGWSLPVAYGWSMADQVTNVMGNLLLFGVLSSVVGLGFRDLEYADAFVIGGALALLFVAGTAICRGWGWRQLRNERFAEWLWNKVPRRFRKEDADHGEILQAIFGPLLHDFGGTGRYGIYLLMSASAFGSLCLANALTLRALGVEAPLLLIAVAVVVGYFAGVMIGIWGGVGVTEAALTGLFVQFGVPAEQAAMGALLHRGIFYLVVLGWGGHGLWAEGRPSMDDAKA
jgi:uncharacterized protein (TIRG00374 family)